MVDQGEHAARFFAETMEIVAARLFHLKHRSARHSELDMKERSVYERVCNAVCFIDCCTCVGGPDHHHHHHHQNQSNPTLALRPFIHQE